MSVSAFAAKDIVPSNDLLADYYSSGEVCVCIYVPANMACNEIVFTGTYNNWSATVSQCKKFEPVEGYDGWYVTAFVPGDEWDFEKGIQGKPVMLDANGNFNWSYQVGAVTIVRGGLRVIEGYPGEIDIVNYGTIAPNVYTVDAWKLNPCTAVYHNYTVSIYAPNACPEMKPAIIGDFNNWSVGVPMTERLDENLKTVYTYTFKDAEGNAFKIREAQDTAWTNEMMYYVEYDEVEDIAAYWSAFENIKLGEQANMVFDWSDNSKYRFSQCGAHGPVDAPVYSFVLLDPVCELHPEFAPMIIGEFNGGNAIPFEKGIYRDRDAWMLTVNAEPGSFYQIYEVNHSYGNSFQYFDTVTGYWWSFHTRQFPQNADSMTIVLNYSNPEKYRYPLCETLVYDDSTYLDFTVTLKSPDGAPEKVAIVGDFISGTGNNWIQGSLMKYKNGVYSVTVRATANSQFKFREYNNSGNYIEYSDGSAMENLVFGEFLDAEQKNAYVDLSNNARYQWFEWSDYTPQEIYSVVAKADDVKNGYVTGSGEYKENEIAVLMATPRMYCTFERWADGSTLNPRSVVVTDDAVYTAVFKRNVPLPPVTCSDTMHFASADSFMIATRVYTPSEIQPYDKLIIATVDNKNIMGNQAQENFEIKNYRRTVNYVSKMDIEDVSVVEVVPHGDVYRLRVKDGELAPRCADCFHKPNQLYATGVGADWYFAKYDEAVVPEAVSYANRMILYNADAPRFSSYRQVTGLNRRQTTVYKLHMPRVIPSNQETIKDDLAAFISEDNPMDDVSIDVEPKDTVAVISTPYVDFVHTFTLIIWADAARTKVLVIITYDAQGNQLSVTRPNAVRRIAAANADVSFEVGDLDPETTYDYTLTACEDDGSILTSLNSSFSTAAAAPEGVQNVLDGQTGIIKFFQNGHLFVLRNGVRYDVTGKRCQ